MSNANSGNPSSPRLAKYVQCNVSGFCLGVNTKMLVSVSEIIRGLGKVGEESPQASCVIGSFPGKLPSPSPFLTPPCTVDTKA